jgi:bifunctional ADP-heptose synthase (sugar kinase/adenylyltransferase)
VVWDPHPRGPAPIAGATLVTPNLAESKALEPGIAGDALPVVATARPRAGAPLAGAAVSVTCGARGAVLVDGAGPPFFAAAEPALGGDPCGAGDRFASCAAGALADGAAMADAVLTAVTSASRSSRPAGAGAIAQDDTAGPSRARARRDRPGARHARGAAAPSSPPAAASTSCTPATSRPCRRHGRWGTASSCA